MNDQALNKLDAPALDKLLEKMGVIKRNTSKEGRLSQLILAINNNIFNTDTPDITADCEISDVHLEIPEAVSFFRAQSITERDIKNLLQNGLDSIGNITSLSDRGIEKLSISVALKDRLRQVLENTVRQDEASASLADDLEASVVPSEDEEANDEGNVAANSARKTTCIQSVTTPTLPGRRQPVTQIREVVPVVDDLLDQIRRSSGKSEWREIRPQQLSKSDDFFTWLDTLEWKLRKHDPSQLTWVDRTEELLTGAAQRASDTVVSKGFTGARYLAELRNQMLSPQKVNECLLHNINNKWKLGDDCTSHYEEFRLRTKLIVPSATEQSIIYSYMMQLPKYLTVALANDGALSGEERFLCAFANRAEILSRNSQDSAKLYTASEVGPRAENPKRNNLRSRANRVNNVNYNRGYRSDKPTNAAPNQGSQPKQYSGNIQSQHKGRPWNNDRRNNRPSNYRGEPQRQLPSVENTQPPMPSTPRLSSNFVPFQTHDSPLISSNDYSNSRQTPEPASQNTNIKSEPNWLPNTSSNQNTYLTCNTAQCIRSKNEQFFKYYELDSSNQFIPNLTSDIPSHRCDSLVLAAIAQYHNLPDVEILKKVQMTFGQNRDICPEVFFLFADQQIRLKALLDSGSSVSILPGEIVDKLRLPLIPCHIKICGVNGPQQPIVPRGISYIWVKTGPDAEVRVQPFYIIDRFNGPILLGRDFMRLSCFNIQSSNDGFIVRRYTGTIIDPLKMEPRLIVGAWLPPSEEFAKVAARFTQINIAPNISRASFVCNRMRIDPIASSETNLEGSLASMITKNLEQNQRQCLWNSISKHISVFSRSKYDLGCVDHRVCNVRINIGNKPVPRCLPNRYSAMRRDQLESVISELKQAGIVENSREPGGAPALLVAKRDGSLRMVVSYIELNRITERRCYPMPNIDDFISSVQGFNYFAILDLAQGYYQIEIPPEERGKTAFVTQCGKYQFTRLPMGLADAPSYFQELMDRVIGDLRKDIAQVYFDDILVKGRTIPELASNLEKVFIELRKFNLKLKWEKCKFGVTELVYLGHLISGKTVRPDPSKVETLLKISLPKTLRQLQSLLGTFNHYSRYVPNYSQIVAPLYRLTTKARKFKLEKSDQQIISKIKSTLARDCMLSIYNPNLPVRLLVDASSIAVAGILEQQESDSWRAISYFGQKLAKHQRNYTVQEKECLAVVLAVCKYKHFLEGRSFVVVSDHHALCSLAKTNFKLERLNRWATVLSQFDYRIIYSKGIHHPADCFTRSDEWKHRCQHDVDEEDLIALYCKENKNSREPNDWNCVANAKTFTTLIEESLRERSSDCSPLDSIWYHNQVLKVITQVPFDRNELSAEQRKDSYCKEIIDDLQSNRDSNFAKKFQFSENVLYRKPMRKRSISRIVLPLSIKNKVIDFYHSGPTGLHFGTNKTYDLVSQYFWCKDMKDWAKIRVENCSKCQSIKKSVSVGNVPCSMPIASYPMERVQIDVVGKMPKSEKGNEFIITAVDMHSGFAWAKATKRTTSPDIVKFMEKIRLEKGVPNFLHSDNGKNFISNTFQSYLSSLGIKHVRSTFYHPQSQGRVERFNGTLIERLKSLPSPLTWDEKLDEAVFKLNSTPTSSTSPSPFFLIHGYEPRTALNNKLQLPTITRDTVSSEREKMNLVRSNNQEKVLKKRLRSKVLPKIKIGDIVKLKVIQKNKTLGKLAPSYSLNNFIVVKIYPNSTCKLVDSATEQTRIENFARLKRVRGRKPSNYQTILSMYNSSSGNDAKNDSIPSKDRKTERPFVSNDSNQTPFKGSAVNPSDEGAIEVDRTATL